MIIRSLSLTAAATVALVLAASIGARPAAIPKLTGVVGPGFTISLKKGLTKVTKLKAGKYIFAISDKSGIHNFQVERTAGAKFAKVLTTVPFTGNKSVTVTLTPGKYRFYCAPHASQMFGLFTVTR